MINYTLKISGIDFKELQRHLFPGDGKEAVAVALCGRTGNKQCEFLLVHQLMLIPYDQCKREPDHITWSTSLLESQLLIAAKKNFAIVKIHSHPGGYSEFSAQDDKSDKELFDSIYGWIDSDRVHGSIIMLPDGELFGRVVSAEGRFYDLDRIVVAGRDLKVWSRDSYDDFNLNDEIHLRTSQAFGLGTTQLIGKLKIGVVGISGTGSIVTEQLSRLGVGTLVLVDPDTVERKNLNRILNATAQDVVDKRAKVDVSEAQIKKLGFQTKVNAHKCNLYDSVDSINDLSTCDLVIGCLDSIDGRHLLNAISSFYLIPYMDLGVKLISDKKGGIEQIAGTIHFLQPGGSSLRTRGVYTSEELRAANLFRLDPNEYNEQSNSGYIKDIIVEAPAVISINMQLASLAINDLLNRIHRYRYDNIEDFDTIRISISDFYLQYERNENVDGFLARFTGRGSMTPMLNMPELSNENKRLS